MSALPNQDEDHLRLLSSFHYIVGSIMALLSCLALIWIAVMVVLFAESALQSQFGASGGQLGMDLFFIILAAVGIVRVGLCFCTIMAGRHIAHKRHYTFIFVMSCIELLWFPFGTALGIFTIIVLSRPSVKFLFGRATLLAA